MEKLSVVIATINDSIATNFTMAQIIHQLEQDELDYEIILVDNGSNEQERQNLDVFLEFHRDYQIKIYDYPIKGTIPPHSFGVGQASGKYITMPDPHMVFSPHYFKVMLETLKEYQPQGYEVVFSSFSVGSITKKGQDVICGSPLTSPSPFGRANGIGESCKLGDKPFPVLSNTMAGFVSEREWFLKIGNMFPSAFVKAGGHTAESLMIGIPTWMFGKKCLMQPKILVEHPSYRRHYGEGRSANMHLSMATGAYICGGQYFLDEMPYQYGKYVDGDLEEILVLAHDAREYIKQNVVMSLDELIKNWEELRVL